MEVPFNPFTLEGKTILVTGASSGIGRETAVVCSKMGARVVITARNEERLAKTANMLTGYCHAVIPSDLSKADQIECLVKYCPSVDGIVHCAGIGDRTLLRSVREKDIERVMNTNFNAPVLLQRLLLKAKKVNDNASIVFIASRAPFAPTIGNGLYSASKGALISYSKVLALELAPKMMRVNCICPSMVWTELIERDAQLMGVDYHEAEKSYPLKRYGQPEDVANLAIYLLSDASSWMTGSCIDITGGTIGL